MSLTQPEMTPVASASSADQSTWQTSVRRIMPLAWPVFIGQIAVLAFATVDTLLIARHSQAALAAFSVGAAAYITIFIGLMGVVLAVSPTVGHLQGAKQYKAAGDELHQGIWLAFGLTMPGCLLLLFPQPFLWLSGVQSEVASGVRGYLLALAFSLPASLLFTVYRGFNTAVSRPKAVMALQVGGLLLKVPLSAALVFGVPALGIPEMGVAGAGLATAVAMWSQCLAGFWILRRDRFYEPYDLWSHGLHPPRWASLKALIQLGFPIGLSTLIEVSAFSFMALFIARLGTVPVAGHQIAINLVSLMFMLPLAIANASSSLVAQHIGAGETRLARRLGWHGVGLAACLAIVLGTGVFLARLPVLHLYTQDEMVISAAMPLLAWLALFHVADAIQTVVAFVLRAWRIATAPMFIYAGALWGVGIGGGYSLAFNLGNWVPAALQGATGFWMAATAGLVVAGAFLAGLMWWVLRKPAAR